MYILQKKYSGIVFCAGKIAKPSWATLFLINSIFKGPAHLVYYITWNLIISASSQKSDR